MRKLELASVLVPSNKVATGNDSCVYRHCGIAVKEYFSATAEHVNQYCQTMNRCVSVIDAVNYGFTLTILGELYDVKFQAVQIDEVTTSPAGKPVTYSRYICEPNLDWLTSPEDHFVTYAPQVGDSRNWEFFRALNAYFNSERPTRLRDEFEYHLCMLSRILDFHLGTFGLYIGKYNVKLQPDLAGKRLTLVVTDVAVYLSRVVRSSNYSHAIGVAETLAGQPI